MDEPSLLLFLNELRRGKVYYRLSQHRDDAIMVEVAVPGERWEVEFLGDGTVEVEVFRSDGNIRGAGALAELLARYADARTDEESGAVAGPLGGMERRER